LKGVLRTSVGYTGGSTPHPTYASVCAGDGHTEAICIEFDPDVLSYAELLRVCFSLHEPTHHASKLQYRSAVWYHSAEQEAVLRDTVARLEAQIPVDPYNCLAPSEVRFATALLPAGEWWDAEEVHQKWVAKRRGEL
jgi:peptide-methionine (S)-S-oxide reductase